MGSLKVTFTQHKYKLHTVGINKAVFLLYFHARSKGQSASRLEDSSWIKTWD